MSTPPPILRWYSSLLRPATLTPSPSPSLFAPASKPSPTRKPPQHGMEPRRPPRKKAAEEKPQKEPAAAPTPHLAVAPIRDGEAGHAAPGGGAAGEEEMKRRGSSSSSSTMTVSAAVKRGAVAAPPCCQAEKCATDLTEAKRYHRRHKVCEVHSKAAVVVVAGLRQRFCQQCSRFHELSEFDDSKRSCRRRLAGHNERRRKSTSDLQGNGGVNSRCCRPGDRGGKIHTSSDHSGNHTYKHFEIK